MDQFLQAISGSNIFLVAVAAVIVIVWQTAIMYSTIQSLRAQIADLKDSLRGMHKDNSSRFDAIERDLRNIERQRYGTWPREQGPSGTSRHPGP